jgi:hypothetical protein
VGGSAHGGPGYAVVLLPLRDLAFPLPLAEPDLLLPGHGVAVLFLHAQDAVHELRKVLEARPVFVRNLHRDGHVRPPLDGQPARLLLAATAAAEFLGSLACDRSEHASLAGEARRGLLPRVRCRLAALLLDLRHHMLAEEVRRLTRRHRHGEGADAGCGRNQDPLRHAVPASVRNLVLRALGDVLALLLDGFLRFLDSCRCHPRPPRLRFVDGINRSGIPALRGAPGTSVPRRQRRSPRPRRGNGTATAAAPLPGWSPRLRRGPRPIRSWRDPPRARVAACSFSSDPRS